MSDTAPAADPATPATAPATKAAPTVEEPSDAPESSGGPEAAVKVNGTAVVVVGSGFLPGELVTVSIGTGVYESGFIPPFETDADGGFTAYGRTEDGSMPVVVIGRADHSTVAGTPA